MPKRKRKAPVVSSRKRPKLPHLPDETWVNIVWNLERPRDIANARLASKTAPLSRVATPQLLVERAETRILALLDGFDLETEEHRLKRNSQPLFLQHLSLLINSLQRRRSKISARLWLGHLVASLFVGTIRSKGFSDVFVGHASISHSDGYVAFTHGRVTYKWGYRTGKVHIDCEERDEPSIVKLLGRLGHRMHLPLSFLTPTTLRPTARRKRNGRRTRV